MVRLEMLYQCPQVKKILKISQKTTKALDKRKRPNNHENTI